MDSIDKKDKCPFSSNNL
nr:hypothetical protein [Sicyoidochytrium minutum DNA virus]